MNSFSNTPSYVWVIIGFLVLSIFVRAWTRFYFSDENQAKIALSKVKKHCGFLFDYSFKIYEINANGANGAWSVVLKSERCKIQIIRDRSDVFCELVSLWASDQKYLDLSSLIASIENKDKNLYYPQTGTNTDVQLEFYGRLIHSHYDQIITFMDNYSRPFSTAYE